MCYMRLRLSILGHNFQVIISNYLQQYSTTLTESDLLLA